MNIFDFIQTNHKLPLRMNETDFETLMNDMGNVNKLKDYLPKADAPRGKKPKIKKGFNAEYTFDSFAEFTFFYYMKYYKGYVVVKNTSDKLMYLDEKGKKRGFIYDFLVNNIKCEVKGFVRPLDQLKREQHPEVEFYYQKQIDAMTKELDEIYGAVWRDSFVQSN